MPNDIEETVNQDIEATEKTFTQDEVNQIIGDRLRRESVKYADYEDLKTKAEKYDELSGQNQALQTELDELKSANAIRDMRSKVAEETGVPANLLTGMTEEECQNQASAILEFKKPKGYPNVRDAGEVAKVGKPSTRQQFADWMDQAFN